MIQKIWDWIVCSSQNAENYSLFVKGLAGFVPSVAIVFAILHIDVSQDSLLSLIDTLAIVVSSFGAVVTAIIALVGAFRKIVSTIMGTNDVVLGWKQSE